jgi:ureidoglycolate hydrolase
MRPIEIITQENFSAFGSVIAFPPEDTGNFYIVASDAEKPWRLAVFRYRNHEIKTIERHPTSMESFEPLSGISLLLVAEPETPEDYHVFLLDKPIILNKGIWHQTMAITESAEVKITENLDVYSEYIELEKAVRVAVL